MLFVNRRTGFRAEIDFRLFRRGDGEGLRRCVEDFYGDGYPYREYLDEEFLLEKIAARDMTVLCGVADKGEIVSTSALCMSREFKGSALLMLRVVKKAYRDMGIGKAQEDRLFQIAGEHPELKSLYADVMTHNSISQRGLIRRGFVYCGLRMMLYRNPIMVPQLSLPPEGRMSQAVMCQKVCAGPVGVLHCPAEHTSICFGISRTIRADGRRCPRFRKRSTRGFPSRSCRPSPMRSTQRTPIRTAIPEGWPSIRRKPPDVTDTVRNA